MISSRIAILFILTLMAGCERAPREAKPDVIILHTGRLRGNVYPASLRGIAPLQHYQYLAGYIRATRAQAEKSGAQVLVIDLGDSLVGSFAAHATDSMNMVTFFNEAGYDAIMLSNLDADVPPASLARLKAKVLIPFLGPDGKTPLPGTAPGVRLDRPGLPVNLLANFYGDASPSDNPGRFPTSFAGVSPVTPVRDYSAILKSLGVGAPDALSLLCWMKFETLASPPEAFLKQLRADNVDAIIAHRVYGKNEREAWQSNGFLNWRPPVSLNILRNNGGFALARLDLARDGKGGWKVLRHELLPMTANTSAADATVAGSVEQYAGVIAAADRPVAALPQAIAQQKILELYMTALTGIPGTDAVAYSLEAIRSDWPPGELRAGTVFNSLPWSTGLVQVKLDAARLRQLPELADLCVLAKRPADGAPVTVTTSRFFGSVIASKFGLSPEEVVAVSGPSEFEFFTAFLASHPDLSAVSAPDGWIVVKP